jgi:HSP20 family protein
MWRIGSRSDRADRTGYSNADSRVDNEMTEMTARTEVTGRRAAMTAAPAKRPEHQPAWWNPFRLFEDLYTQMGRVWEAAFGSGSAAGPAGGWAPCADVCETQDTYVVDIEVPGVKQQDLDVKLSGDELAVMGELKETEREGLFRKRTRRTGQFTYRLSLPRYVKFEDITANLSDGVLTLRIPKAEITGPRKIEIAD